MSTFSDNYIVANAKFFPEEKIPFIKEKLDNLPQEKEVFVSALELKDPMTMLIISWFGGVFGIDRFLLGETMLGVVKLLTAGGCGIWALVDLFLIMKATKDANFNKLMAAL